MIIMYIGNPPYNHPTYKTTSLLGPYPFNPNFKITDRVFYYFEDPVNVTTLLLWPGFYGQMVVTLRYHPG